MSKDIRSQRPLSPHLQIYKWQMTMATSILHRISGFGLSLGLVLFAAWLWGAAYSPELLSCVNGFAQSIVGVLMLAGWSFAFYYHLANGIRHLIWDTGRMMKIEDAYKGGYAVLGFTLSATFGTWVYLAVELL